MSCLIQEVDPENVDMVLPIIKKIFPNADIEVDEDDLFYVAIHKSRIVGFLHITEKEKYFILKGIGVDERYRNFGNGTSLMEKVEELSKLTEKKIVLKVKCMNPAISLYERFGFTMARPFGPVYTLIKKVHN